MYSLIYVSILGDKQTIPFKLDKEVIRNQLALTTIDSFTSYFASDESLTENLNERGYELESGSFHIGYKYRGKNKKLEVIYSNKKRLALIARKNEGVSIVKKDTNFTEYFYFVINTLKIEPKLLNYLKSYHFISEKFAIDVQEFIYFTNCDNIEGIFQSRTHINSYLSKYKNIRNIEIGISKYRQRGEITVDTPEPIRKKYVKKPEQLRLF